MKRLTDVLLSFLLLCLLSPLLILISIFVKATSKGPVFYLSERIGKDRSIFKMPKFRTMRVGTPALATHLFLDLENCFTPIGSYLRKSSLDELPQLFSILLGDMSFVGPRPALFNQDDLITSRTQKNIHHLLPGLTGWAQVNGRDELLVSQTVELDCEYLHQQSFFFDLKILWMTVIKVLTRNGVSH